MEMIPEGEGNNTYKIKQPDQRKTPLLGVKGEGSPLFSGERKAKDPLPETSFDDIGGGSTAPSEKKSDSPLEKRKDDDQMTRRAGKKVRQVQRGAIVLEL